MKKAIMCFTVPQLCVKNELFREETWIKGTLGTSETDKDFAINLYEWNE